MDIAETTKNWVIASGLIAAGLYFFYEIYVGIKVGKISICWDEYLPAATFKREEKPFFFWLGVAIYLLFACISMQGFYHFAFLARGP